MKGVLSCCLALALLMGGLILKRVERTRRGQISQNPLRSWGSLPTPRVPATQAGDGRERPALILVTVVSCMLWSVLLGGRVGLGMSSLRSARCSPKVQLLWQSALSTSTRATRTSERRRGSRLAVHRHSTTSGAHCYGPAQARHPDSCLRSALSGAVSAAEA